MSADNYYEVRKHPNGGFTYVMGFDSERGFGPSRNADINDPQFSDVWAAYSAAANEWAEYPTTFHPECESALRDYWGPRHVPGHIES
jgi:hypothetical protein